MQIHFQGERRRSLALACLVTGMLYSGIWAASIIFVKTPVGQAFAEYLTLPAYAEMGSVAIVWVGVFLIALSQKELIAAREGSYVVLHDLTDVRGMIGIGLGWSTILIALLIGLFIWRQLTITVVIMGGLAAATLFFLGLPDAPLRRYRKETTVLNSETRLNGNGGK